ncbi:hypothetical protein F2Q69_00038902 [Brassica cretica]|uniref:Uncharacterized protein n=1 Tax=Brassica cretica TaxID=69181 RepID=A0A8S9SL30_BRACR|nr:hypothetical protein F2Q69_00038902 [Brassica cretica]
MQKSKREDRESIYDKTPERIIGCVIDSRVLMSVSDASAIRAKETELWNYDPQLTGRGVVDEKDQARPARCVSVFQAASVLQMKSWSLGDVEDDHTFRNQLKEFCVDSSAGVFSLSAIATVYPDFVVYKSLL